MLFRRFDSQAAAGCGSENISAALRHSRPAIPSGTIRHTVGCRLTTSNAQQQRQRLTRATVDSVGTRKASSATDTTASNRISSGTYGQSRSVRGRRPSGGEEGAEMAAAASQAAPKLKLLCLHGYMQNAEVFRSRLGSMRKALKSRVEFVFIDAPFDAQGLPGSDDPDEVQGARDGRPLSWWNFTDSGPYGRPSKAMSYTGWEVAQSSLLAALQEHRPDGLLGFSQGATAAALLLSHLATMNGTAAVMDGGTDDDSSRPVPSTASTSNRGYPTDLLEAVRHLKCAILVAGFLPHDPSVATLVQRGGPSNTVPLLFITGKSDMLVPPERTTQLWDCFNPSNVSSYTHEGAHLVPTCSGRFKSILLDFLSAALGPDPVPSMRSK